MRPTPNTALLLARMAKGSSRMPAFGSSSCRSEPATRRAASWRRSTAQVQWGRRVVGWGRGARARGARDAYATTPRCGVRV
eukprot:3472461-Prymnesium_polylepis.1